MVTLPAPPAVVQVYHVIAAVPALGRPHGLVQHLAPPLPVTGYGRLSVDAVAVTAPNEGQEYSNVPGTGTEGGGGVNGHRYGAASPPGGVFGGQAVITGARLPMR